MIVPLAVGRNTIADYVEALFIVYFVLIFIRILLSWVPRMPYNPTLRAVVRMLATSEPQPGSLTPRAPMRSPARAGARNSRFCSSVPSAPMTGVAICA